MWQATRMEHNVVEGSKHGTQDIKVEPSEHDDTKGLANVWYEASISSVRAEMAFRVNEAIEFGEEAEWKEWALTDRGVFKDMYRAAISMVENEKMDRIGSGDDNGQKPPEGSKSLVHVPKPNPNIEDPKGDFW